MSSSRRRRDDRDEVDSHKRQRRSCPPVSSSQSSPTSPCFSMLVSNSCSSSRCPARHLTYRRAISDYMSHEQPPRLPTPSDQLTPHFSPRLYQLLAVSSPSCTSSSPAMSSLWTAVLPLPITAHLSQLYKSSLFDQEMTGVIMPSDDEVAAASSASQFGCAVITGVLQSVQQGMDRAISAVEAAIASTPPVVISAASSDPTSPLYGSSIPATSSQFEAVARKPAPLADDTRSSSSAWLTADSTQLGTRTEALSTQCATSPSQRPRSAVDHTSQGKSASATSSKSESPQQHELSPSSTRLSCTSSTRPSAQSTCYHFRLCQQPSCSLSHSYAALLAAHISGGSRQQYVDTHTLPTASTTFSPVFNTPEHLLSSPANARCRYMLCLPLPCLTGCVLRLLGIGGRVKEAMWQLTRFSFARMDLDWLRGGEDAHQVADPSAERTWINWWITGDWASLDGFLECVLYLMEMRVWSIVSVVDLSELTAHFRRYQADREDYARSGRRDKPLYCLFKRGYDTPLFVVPSSQQQRDVRGSRALSPPRRSRVAESLPRREEVPHPISPASSTTSASTATSPSAAEPNDTTTSAAPSSHSAVATPAVACFAEAKKETSSPSSDDSGASTPSPTSNTTPPAPSLPPSSIDAASWSVLQSMRATGLHLSYPSDLSVPDYSKVRVPFIRVCDGRVFASWPIPAVLRDEVAYTWDADMMLNSAIEAKWAVSLYLPKRKDDAKAGEWCNVSMKPQRREGEVDDGERARPHALDEPLVAFIQRAKRVEEMMAAVRRPTAPATATVATARSTHAATDGNSSPATPRCAVPERCERKARVGKAAVEKVRGSSKRRSEMDSLADYLTAGSRYHAPSPVASSNTP